MSTVGRIYYKWWNRFTFRAHRVDVHSVSISLNLQGLNPNKDFLLVGHTSVGVVNIRVNVKRQRAAWRKHRRGTRHLPSSVRQLLFLTDWHAHVGDHTCPLESPIEKPDVSLQERKIQTSHPNKAPRQNRKIGCELLPLFASSLEPTHSLFLIAVSIWRGGDGGDEIHFQKTKRVLASLASCCSSSQCVLPLPPGEERSSTLETLRVRLTIGSLGGSGSFDNHWGHLDQLQGCFVIL